MKMKTLVTAFALTAFAISLNSCKKNDTADEIETTFQLSGDQAIADNLTQDANDIYSEAAAQNNLMGNGPVGSTGVLGCATVTITPLMGWPKLITIDFGAACTDPRGNTRRGIIRVNLSDSVRKPGSIAIMTFDNYYVNGYKKEGTITWTNTSTPPTVISWQRKVENGKITSPSGNYWLHSGIKNVVMTAGYGTPGDVTDDEYSVTGNHTVTNSAGATRTATVLTPLIKKTACANIDKGTVKIQGPNHYAIIDFGNGTCDNLATVSIDGRTPRTIILR